MAILTGLVLGCSLIFLLDAIRRELTEGPELFITGRTSGGLVPGSEVWVAGKRAGRVLSVRFRDPRFGEDRVIVRAVLHQDAASSVGRNAAVRFHPSALLAPAVVAVAPGPPGGPALRYPDTLAVTETVTPEDLGRRLATLREEIEKATASAEEVGELALSAEGSLARLRRDPEVRRKLAAGFAALRDGATAVRENRGLARLLKDGTVAEARTVAERLAELEPYLEQRGTDLDRLAARAEGLGRRLDALDRRFARADGSAARFVRDPALQMQIAILRGRLAELPGALLADPLAWLRLRLF